MAELTFNSILGQQEIDTLFAEPENLTPEVSGAPAEKDADERDKHDEQQTETTTEAVNPEDLFQDDQPESVGSGENNEGKEDAVPDKGDDTSPENLYSSIASALAVDGIFPNLDEDVVKKADSAEAFSELIEAEANARLDEKQRRVSKALDNGVEPSDIRKYENTIQYIDSITEVALSEESQTGENLRKSLLVQDFLNKGYTPEKADKLAQRSIDAGTDLEDAKEALQSNREFFQNAYNDLLRKAQEQADKEKADQKKRTEQLKDSLYNDKQLLGDIEISNDVRKKAFDNVLRPTYRDAETGEYLTAVQRYQKEHPNEFLKYVGLVYTMTDGFKDFNMLVKGKVNKEVKKGLRALEEKLNTTKRTPSGSLKMVGEKDTESYSSGNIRLAL